jgi:hypothetical protein
MMTTLISRKSMLATAVLGALFWLGVRAFAADASASCNRHCLLEILTTYTEALTDNDTSRLHVNRASEGGEAPDHRGGGDLVRRNVGWHSRFIAASAGPGVRYRPSRGRALIA